MPKITTNYGLKKPTTNENVDINVLNDNMDKIDEELFKRAVKPTVLTGTLATGNTSLTLKSDAVTKSSIIDIYTSVYGINPSNVSVSTGSITLTFDAQESSIEIRVEVR